MRYVREIIVFFFSLPCLLPYIFLPKFLSSFKVYFIDYAITVVPTTHLPLSPTTHKLIDPYWHWFLRGWVCVCSRALGVSPSNSPVRLGVFPAAATPTGFYCQRFWSFISLHWNPGLHGLSCSPVVPPSYLYANMGLPSPSATALLCILSAWLPISASPTGLNGCFFFNSLVVRLPYSLIFWQFWLFFVF